MSWSIHIFADAPIPVEAFIADVENLFSMVFTYRSDEYNAWYEYNDATVNVTAGVHDFVNDSDIAFEDYHFDVDFWPHYSYEEAVREKWRAEIAPAYFEKLKATGRYSLMLVEDVQLKLAEYHLPLAAESATLAHNR